MNVEEFLLKHFIPVLLGLKLNIEFYGEWEGRGFRGGYISGVNVVQM